MDSYRKAVKIGLSGQEIGYMRGVATVYLVLSSLLSFAACSSATATESHAAKASTHSRQFTGVADYYHHKFYGRKTASGEVLIKEKLTAAHRSLPFGTKLKVTNKRNGHSCIVVINDRGPFTAGKVIDLSHEAAKRLGVLESGTALVACSVVDGEDDEDE